MACSLVLPPRLLIDEPAVRDTFGVPELYCDGVILKTVGDMVRVWGFLRESDAPDAPHVQNFLLNMHRRGAEMSCAWAGRRLIPELFGPRGLSPAAPAAACLVQ